MGSDGGHPKLKSISKCPVSGCEPDYTVKCVGCDSRDIKVVFLVTIVNGSDADSVSLKQSFVMELIDL